MTDALRRLPSAGTPGAGADAQLAWKFAAADRAGATLTHWRDPASNETRLQLWWQHLLR